MGGIAVFSSRSKDQNGIKGTTPHRQHVCRRPFDPSVSAAASIMVGVIMTPSSGGRVPAILSLTSRSFSQEHRGSIAQGGRLKVTMTKL
jgi:hypothetical protein